MSVVKALEERIQQQQEKVNDVRVCGFVSSKPQFSHNVYNTNFYEFLVKVERVSSDSIDTIPVVISEDLLRKFSSLEKKQVLVTGQFHSFNEYSEDDGKTHLKLFIFAKDISLINAEVDSALFLNNIFLDGYICKPTVFRTTPFGKHITEIFLAVNRNFFKTDYIPCIAWEKLAYAARNFSVGTRIQIIGRIQSRVYSTPSGESREICEISIFEMSKVEKN